MAITDRFILPLDVELAPVADFDSSSIAGLEFDQADWIITRISSRSRSSIISADLAELLQNFRTGNSIIDVIMHYSKLHALDPKLVLDEIWPAISRFIHANWLVPEHSYLIHKPAPWYTKGTSLLGLAVESCVNFTDDTQVYRAYAASGENYAIKVVHESIAANVEALEAEASILKRLNGTPSPRFIDLGSHGERRILVMEWCEGLEITSVAKPPSATRAWREHMRDLLVSVLTSYASLHAQGVIHGDVHPGNLLLERQGNIRILDFGLARVVDDPTSGARRGGAPEYFDPEYAAAALTGMPPPLASAASEQYALAALCYRLAVGSDYLNFPPESARFYDQIVNAAPMAFADAGAMPWPELEQVLGRALSKASAARFESVADMAAAVSTVNIGAYHLSSGPRPNQTGAIQLIRQVNRRVDPANELFARGPSSRPRATFMAGAAGIAYYLLRAALLTGDPRSLAAADQWAERAGMLAREPLGIYDESAGVVRDTVGSISPYHTHSGIELIRGLIAHARGDTSTLLEAAQSYLQLVDDPRAGLDPTLGITSVLTGYEHLVQSLRAGHDYDQRTQQTLDLVTRHGNAVADHVIGEISQTGPTRKDNLVVYTGAAHGWAGLLYTLLTWCEITGREIDDVVLQRLSELAALAVKDGRGLRWPMRIHNGLPAFMNSWCHGSPGHVYLWNAAHRILGDKVYSDLAVAAAFATHDEEGANTTVCCGQAGQVFALLNMYRHSRDELWLQYARERLQTAIASTEWVPAGQLRDSLYRGDIGLALAATELQYPAEARQPLYEGY